MTPFRTWHVLDEKFAFSRNSSLSPGAVASSWCCLADHALGRRGVPSGCLVTSTIAMLRIVQLLRSLIFGNSTGCSTRVYCVTSASRRRLFGRSSCSRVRRTRFFWRPLPRTSSPILSSCLVGETFEGDDRAQTRCESKVHWTIAAPHHVRLPPHGREHASLTPVHCLLKTLGGSSGPVRIPLGFLIGDPRMGPLRASAPNWHRSPCAICTCGMFISLSMLGVPNGVAYS